MQTFEGILQDVFGYRSFRPGQKEIIENICAGKDVLAILPTGGGKSLCYQIPALYLDGVAVIISPLISLMKDQVDEVESLGISCRYINSQTDRQTYEQTLNMARSGHLKMLYIAPERLENELFIEALKTLPISFVAVDEAHCISQWGHDFRPSYKKIKAQLKKADQEVGIAAFTATATEQVQQDIRQQLDLQDPFVWIGGFNRPNLYFEIEKPKNKKEWLRRNIEKEQSCIIYCNTRKNVEDVYRFLKDRYFSVTYYHAGLSDQLRNQNQEDFIYDRKEIIVATNAFGMGINKSNVRQVIHYNMPQNLESYYQEAGRAGRDGAPAKATLLFSSQDIVMAKFLLSQSQQPHGLEKMNDMIGYVYTGQCLRNYILKYFGDAPEKCDFCSICDGTLETTDITREAQMILSCVSRLRQRFGATMVVDVLRGSRNEKVLSYGYQKLPTYGLMRRYAPMDIRHMISLLVYEDFLEVSGEQYPILKLTSKSPALLRQECQVQMNTVLKLKPQNRQASKQAKDEVLFAQLRLLRSEIARNLDIAPYMVFSDATLLEMCQFLPTTGEAFLAISGVGEKKLKAYGTAFMTLIKQYTENKNNT